MKESDTERTKYILILLITLFMWLFPGGMLLSLLGRIYFFSSTKIGAFILVFVPHLVMLASLEVLLRVFFHRGTLSYIDDKLNICKFIKISSITLVIYILYSLISFKTIKRSSESITDTILFFLLSLILFLPQTLIEEMVFRLLPHRIYSPQKCDMKRLEKITLSLLCGFFFLIPHVMNVEVTESSNFPIIQLIVYFLWGFLSSLLSLCTLSYTSVWAMHYMNNIFSTAIVGGVNTTLSGAPLFIDSRTYCPPLLILLIIVLFLIIFLFERKECEKTF